MGLHLKTQYQFMYTGVSKGFTNTVKRYSYLLKDNGEEE